MYLCFHFFFLIVCFSFLSSFSFATTWISQLCYFQVNQLQHQISSLKTSNENHQKQIEDLVSKLKEVCNFS